MIVGYLRSLEGSRTAMQRGRIRAALMRGERALSATRFVELGATLSGERGARRLTRADGVFFEERDLTTTAMDYAAWLIAQRDAPKEPMPAAEVERQHDQVWDYAGRCVRARR